MMEEGEPSVQSHSIGGSDDALLPELLDGAHWITVAVLSGVVGNAAYDGAKKAFAISRQRSWSRVLPWRRNSALPLRRDDAVTIARIAVRMAQARSGLEPTPENDQLARTVPEPNPDGSWTVFLSVGSAEIEARVPPAGRLFDGVDMRRL